MMSIFRLAMVYFGFGAHGFIGVIEFVLATIHHHEGQTSMMFCYGGIAVVHLMIFVDHSLSNRSHKPSAH